ncbi:MAG: Fe-S cluster assembly ATPase SufC [Gammaproteobacteria bacterium]|nr:Fe-S cluster assembly ATPase SufC [Gammaproteobacteria bacterium]MCD8542440.1 Fe-S cluster assembly ATPase SufC [Gammaproteobacteria bacterium]
MLEIKNLHANISERPLLKGVNLTISAGEVHAIMGPNGSGKSTLASLLAGKKDYTITEGEILFEGKNIQDLSIDERARLGLFLGFQYPVEIPGVTTAIFLRAAYNSQQKARGLEPIDAMDFLSIVKEKMALINMDPDFLYRSVNEGFSGGEKKRHDIMQMLLLEPKLAILDEIDSGLDIDALQMVSQGINLFRHSERALLLITHYQRLLNHIEPDYVHVFSQGRIVASGDKTLAQKLEKEGYAWLEGGHNA